MNIGSMIRPRQWRDVFIQPRSINSTTAPRTRHPDSGTIPAIGAVVPHAGYIYSGQVAGAVYSRIEIPRRNVVLCPNHTGYGPALSIMREGEWQTPLGRMQIDSELCDALMAADPHLQHDVVAHRFEHALEVQLPFLQYAGGPCVRFVPIVIGSGSWKRLEEVGVAIARPWRKSIAARSSSLQAT